MITEVLQGLGGWNLRLREGTPRELIDVLRNNYYGHIAIAPGRMDVKAVGDGLLTSARYVGVYRHFFRQPDEFEIKGDGMAWWLGDSDDRGDLITTNRTYSASTFAAVVRNLLPTSGAVQEGTIFTISSSATFSGNIAWQTPRKALTRVATYFTSTASDPVEWVVRNNGKLDAGQASSLYSSFSNPSAILVKKKQADRDMARVSFDANMSMDSDVEDYTTDVYVIGQGEGDAAPVGHAIGSATPYRNLFGNPVVIAQVLSGTEATAAEATAAAGVELSDNAGIRQATQLSTEEFDIRGTFGAGDWIYVFDPDAGFVNTNLEVMFQGVPVNPLRLRVSEVTYPVPLGWTVAFRANDGTWYDLSDYYAPESGTSNVVVGDFLRRLSGGFSPDINGRATPDASTPGVPTFGTFFTGAYESLVDRQTRAQIQLNWTKPNNTDGSTLIDLDHYEIRYRPNTRIGYAATHAQMATKPWNQLLTHGQPLVPPLSAEWQTIFVGGEVTTFMVQELTPSVSYEFQIRAVDTASPPHFGAWSGTTAFTAARDTKAPNQPAPPSVASSLIAIQIVHSLGSSSGGTFTLDSDLDHLEVHVGGSEHFGCDDGTRVGKLVANAGMLRGQIPAVGTFGIPQTTGVYVRVIAVDISGNRSSPSDAVQATASLIDDQYISSLSVSKLTAGTITARLILGGSIQTAESGQRAGLDSGGFFAYNSSGEKTFSVDSVTGNIFLTGTVQTGTKGQRIVITDVEPANTIQFFGTRESNKFSYINSPDFAVGERVQIGVGINSSTFPDSVDGVASHTRAWVQDFIQLATVEDAGQTPRGGYLFFTATGGEVGFQLRSGETGDTNRFTFQSDVTAHYGKWDNFIDRGANAGLFTGFVTTGATVTSTAVSFGTTRASTIVCMAQLRDSGTTPTAIQISAQTTTGFTATYSAATNGTAVLNFWCFRV